MDKIVSCLTLRFTATPNEVRAALPATMEQWAKLRILPEGDTIRAAEMENYGEDTRDATYVRVCTCVFHTSGPKASMSTVVPPDPEGEYSWSVPPFIQISHHTILTNAIYYSSTRCWWTGTHDIGIGP